MIPHIPRIPTPVSGGTIMFDEWTLLALAIVMLAGILLFDLFLFFFNGRMTISRACITISRERPWIGILICAAICFLIAHFWAF